VPLRSRASTLFYRQVYRQGIGLMSPADVLGLRSQPAFVSYE
jgi:hypothetical protein